MILVVTMQALCFAAGTNLHAERCVDDCVTGVGMARLAVVVVGCLVDEDGEELVDQGINEPFFAGSLGAGDEESAAAGFGREEIALMFV